MPSPFDGSLNQQRRRPAMATASSRSAFGYWIPLALTVTAATAGIAAWALRGRGDGIDAAESERQRRRRDPRNRRPSVQKRDSSYGDGEGVEQSITAEAGDSAQRMYDQARGAVAAGTAALEELVDQGTRSPASEPDEDDADKAKDEARRAKRKALQTERSYQRQTQAKRKLVAVVVSAESQAQVPDDDGTADEDSTSPIQSSLLAHLDPHIDEETTQLVILLYAPHLRAQPISSLPRSGAASRPSPDDEEADSGPDTAYDAISQQAQSLVSDATHVLPFTTPSGHIHILRHMTPSVVYIEESLCGGSGELVDMINGWVGQIIVVVGADGPGGVEAGTGDEAGDQEVDAGNTQPRQDKWWQNEKMVGLGRGIEVVETLRIGDDWKRRVER